ncbi:YiiD C-terminal domain-containing protein [Alkalilimnicola sp. S0819]|uniref:YiiD C-terminal domain-containing protein n=1 Tax=Alkalilimnicola sp. S0819 TaxID=2613922 RepID=UPI0012619667|nr:YiiD C-terminal domain-containing protein [Alkalilimnicola sp. S0819]KAB7627450.1 DUF4442 domain-containing protein [Alkalilimnicola sp. S0819]MPQ15599.1 DUF4442 domain-containing protein [Alkalilimnicola sp. S0819]
MDKVQLQAALHRLIPLSAAMGLEVERLEPECLVLGAPLARNHNHSGQGFAGAIYSLASLGGWAMLYRLVQERGLSARLVLGEARIRYSRPLEDDLRVRVALSLTEQRALVARLENGRTARLTLRLSIPDTEAPAAVFHGEYFAKPEAPATPG